MYSNTMRKVSQLRTVVSGNEFFEVASDTGSYAREFLQVAVQKGYLSELPQVMEKSKEIYAKIVSTIVEMHM